MQLKINNLKYLIKPVYRTVLVSIFMTGAISAQEIIEENKDVVSTDSKEVIDTSKRFKIDGVISEPHPRANAEAD